MDMIGTYNSICDGHILLDEAYDPMVALGGIKNHIPCLSLQTDRTRTRMFIVFSMVPSKSSSLKKVDGSTQGKCTSVLRNIHSFACMIYPRNIVSFNRRQMYLMFSCFIVASALVVCNDMSHA